jgi:hypothetical protein
MTFTYKLEQKAGTPADPPMFRSSVGVTWNAGDTVLLGARTLRVLAVRDDDADQAPVLVIEDCPEQPLANDAA